MSDKIKVKALDTETNEVHTWICVRCKNCDRYNIDNPNYKFCPYCGADLKAERDKQ